MIVSHRRRAILESMDAGEILTTGPPRADLCDPKLIEGSVQTVYSRGYSAQLQSGYEVAARLALSRRTTAC